MGTLPKAAACSIAIRTSCGTESVALCRVSTAFNCKYCHTSVHVCREMEEIANSFAEAGVPRGFHDAAAELYSSLAHHRSRDVEPGLASTKRLAQEILDGKGSKL